MQLIGGEGSPEEPRPPPGYILGRSDPDVLILRCPHGAVARFSARGAAAEAIEREARSHHRARNWPARGALAVVPASSRGSVRPG
jgi:hypothetical protein